MKRFLTIFLLISVYAAATYARLSPLPPDSVASAQDSLAAPWSGVFLRTDTIQRTDTVVTTQIIRRTEIVRRSEAPVAFPSVARVYSPDSINHAAAGGRYFWIPDSLQEGVASLLDGKMTLKEFEREDERVTFRGDTIPMKLRDRNFGRFDRGLFNYLFIPKGIWTIGVTASYGEFSTADLEILDLVSDVDFSGHIFSIRPYFSYFINNNMSVGMRVSYTTGKARIDSFKVDIDEDMNFNLHDIMYRSESYTAAVTFNQYLGIARRGRFGIFNEVELAFSSGFSDFQRPYNGEPRLTHTTTMSAALNFSPGVSVFIMDPVSFNVSFGVFGFQLKNDKQTVNGEKMGSRFTSSANFRFNIFNINFGIAVNL